MAPSGNNAEPRSEEGTSDPKKQQRHWLDYLAVVFSALALIIASFAAGFTWWQAILIGQNTVVSQRAFVFVSNVGVGPGVDMADKTTKTIAVFFQFTNSGNTATRDFTFFARCAKSVDPTPEPWVLLNENIPRTPDVIGPHGVSGAACGFGTDDFDGIGQGKLLGYLLVNASYRDRLSGMIRRTQISRQITYVDYSPTKEIRSVGFQPSGRHNCADEECPDN